MVGGMAFGSSWGVTRSFTKQTADLKHLPRGETGDVHFDLKLPDIANSTMIVFGVGQSLEFPI